MLTTALLALAFFAHAAEAQDGDPRALFQEGVGAAGRGEFDEARRLFERSLELEGNVATAFNLATVYERLERPAACKALVQEAVAGEFGSTGERAGDFVRLLERCAAATGSLEVRGPAGASVQVDERAFVMDAGGSLRMDLDPGSHTVALQHQAQQSERRLRIRAGERRVIELLLMASAEVAPAPVTTNADAPNHRGRRVGIVVALAVAVGAAVGVGIWAARRPDASVVDPVWGNPQALVAF